jgi:hypothetical protein
MSGTKPAKPTVPDAMKDTIIASSARWPRNAAAAERASITYLVRRWYESGGFDGKSGTFTLKCLLDELEKPAATEATR